MIGCTCEVCQSTDPRDSRTRSSIYVRVGKSAFLVDTTPDLRQQALREKLAQVNAVVITHPHADHIMGFDDLRRFCDLNGGTMPVFGSAATLDQLQRSFHYAFDLEKKVPGYVKAIPQLIKGPFDLFGLRLTPLPVPHGNCLTYGFLFERNGEKVLAYLSDCKTVPPEVEAAIENVPVLIIDGLRDEPHPTHLSIPEAIDVGRRVKAGAVYLTHLTHQKSHAERERELPSGVKLAFDGMKLTL